MPVRTSQEVVGHNVFFTYLYTGAADLCAERDDAKLSTALGRLWTEGHPNAELKAGWKYYLDEAEQEPDVEAQLAKIRKEYQTIKPEEIKVIDIILQSLIQFNFPFDILPLAG